MHKYKLLIGSAMLAVVSLLMQVYKVAYPMGVIDIDIVGVPWLISTFLFGLSGGIITSVVSTIGIAQFATAGPIGAIMKFLATIVMVLIVGAVGWKWRFTKKSIVIAFAACLVARPVIMTFFNYYLGAPLFFGISSEVAIQQFPPEVFLIPNAILAVIDFWVAYLIVFKTSLRARLNVAS